ncbi:MAG: Rrf2 family transcriptional regulator [Alphaproteobacteria bacterium]|nr:Rrf2 family transcriptional regulator [Alphaproteobacteria bacterium]
MKLSTRGRYAVMAMADLAAHSNGRPISLADIAGRQEISLSYLEQLFGRLRKGGLVRSVRGPGGGYLLGRSSQETRIADIVLAVDEPIRATRCKSGSPKGCHGNSGRCLTHDLWEELGNHIHLFLNSVSLADVVGRRVLGASGELHRGEPLAGAEDGQDGAPVSIAAQ